MNSRYEEPIELYDQDIDERVLGKIEEGQSMLTALCQLNAIFINRCSATMRIV